MTPTYSIVIPVYNAAQYLENCIHSVFKQQTAAAIEIILVNDGSTDGSAQICDQYAANYPYVKVVHQVNQGVSAARNAGIQEATGEYVLFLDGDDYWDDTLLQTLDRVICRKPDILEFGYQKFGTKESFTPVYPAVLTADMTGMEYFDAHKNMGVMPIASSCTAAFKRQMLEESEILFPAGVRYGEDFDFHMQCLKVAKTVASLQKALYWYRMNEQSATHTVSVEKTRDMLAACVKMYRQFPCEVFANYYCMKILGVANLSRPDAAQMKDLLQENRDILRHISGKKEQLVSMLYRILGWYDAARLIRCLLNAKHLRKG